MASFFIFFQLFFMSNCSILFLSDNGGESSSYQLQGNFNRRGSLVKIDFSLGNESGLNYVFSVLENKVMLSTKGEFNYSFCLEKDKTFNFLIEIQNKQFNASVYCNDLAVKILETEILVDACYLLDFGGNKSENKIKLKVII